MENNVKTNEKYISPECIEQMLDIARSIRARFAQRNQHPVATVITYGCQQNENDSERIKGMLAEMGYGFTEDKAESDLILFNTCAVRENAEKKLFGNVGALKHYKQRKPSLKIIVCGCVVGQPHAERELKQKYPFVDLVFDTKSVYRFPLLLQRVLFSDERVFETGMADTVAEGIPVLHAKQSSAFVSVMYGCNNFCSYCIVPYVRGRERSRKPEYVVEEVRKLVENGCRDITLLGQNVNSYGKDLGDIDFTGLLEKLEVIEGDFLLRFMTSHPKDMSDRLIAHIAKSRHMPHHIHLPFQSGNDRILKAMNRGYTKADYLALIERIRTAMPDATLTSDIIVGFPTETYEEFLDTIDVVKKARFDTLFTFLYSKRIGTPAAVMEGQIPDDEKHRRFDELIAVQNEISKQINLSYVGHTVKVLADGTSKTDSSVMSGRIDANKVVDFTAPCDVKGKLCIVRITEAKTWSLFGEFVDFCS